MSWRAHHGGAEGNGFSGQNASSGEGHRERHTLLLRQSKATSVLNEPGRREPAGHRSLDHNTFGPFPQLDHGCNGRWSLTVGNGYVALCSVGCHK
jgi:hypothetical protein